MAQFIIPRGEDPVTPDEKAEFLKYICPPDYRGGPFDRVAPTRRFRRNLDVSISLPLPAAVAARTRARRNDIKLWIIEDPAVPSNVGRTFPSPLIRTVQGDVVQADVGFKLNTHTIHWHGIEGSTLNDGVGHTSFEATNSFVYQFATNSAGTFFYHCHKNTVLHFEMGLYSGLIVDPRNPGTRPDIPNPPYRTGGPGFAAANLNNFPVFPGFVPASFVVPYDVEAFWAVDSFDSLWHEFNHDEGMQACEANDPVAADTFTQDSVLNDFRPDIFVVSGVVSVPTTPAGVPELGAVITNPRVAITARRNQTILIRLLNADYLIHETTLGLDAIAIGSDGHPFGVPPFDQYSSAFTVPANSPIRTTSARRYDLLVRTPATTGTIPVTFRFYDWVRGPDTATPKLFHTARTVINVI